MDINWNAYGRTWVGENVPFPNKYRVWRNTQSFETRRGATDDYCDVWMRLIPKNAHPETDNNS